METGPFQVAGTVPREQDDYSRPSTRVYRHWLRARVREAVTQSKLHAVAGAVDKTAELYFDGLPVPDVVS